MQFFIQSKIKNFIQPLISINFTLGQKTGIDTSKRDGNYIYKIQDIGQLTDRWRDEFNRDWRKNIQKFTIR